MYDNLHLATHYTLLFTPAYSHYASLNHVIHVHNYIDNPTLT